MKNKQLSQTDLLHDTADIRQQMANQFARWARGNTHQVTAIPWLTLYSRTESSTPHKHVFEASLVVVLQGRKQVTVGEEVFYYDESQFLLAAIDMPVVSHVVEAAPDKPYLAMIAKLDLVKVRQLILEYQLPTPKVTTINRGIVTGPATPELYDTFWRILDLLDQPSDIPVLADLLHKEMLYYLLKSEQGSRLWQMAMSGSQSHRIQQVINWLRRHYNEPLRMEELAEMAAMSISTVHHHFREITSMSPLQFQKQLRLQEARRLMLVEDLDAGTAAYRVGYESVSQFSREYSRYFGLPPMRDIRQLRTHAPTLAEQLEAL